MVISCFVRGDSNDARVQKSEQNLEEGGGGSSVSFVNEGCTISETLKLKKIGLVKFYPLHFLVFRILRIFHKILYHEILYFNFYN